VVAGPPARLLVAGAPEGADPPVAFVARRELKTCRFGGAAVSLADAFGNAANLAAAPGGSGGGGEDGAGEGEGEGDGRRAAKRARREGAGAGGGGPALWRLELLLRHRVAAAAEAPLEVRNSVLQRLAFDASGRCAVPAVALGGLPLGDAGDYALVARALPPGGGDGGGDGHTADTLAHSVEAVLARYQIASADTAALLQELQAVRSERAKLLTDSADAALEASARRAKLADAQRREEQAKQQLQAVEERRGQLEARADALARMLQHRPQQRLPVSRGGRAGYGQGVKADIQ
jgi:hypothetical protein